MKTWSIGVVGAGKITHSMHLPVLLNLPRARVAWVADVDAQRAQAVARAYGVPFAPVPQSLSELSPADVVLLAIPVGYRTAYYEALGQRGSAVFAEKPFASSAAEHRRLLELFAPERVGCGYMRRLYESSVILKQAIDEQWFGPLKGLRISEGARTTGTAADKSAYDDFKASGGGVLMTLGTHSLDLALHLTGATEFQILESQIILDGKIDRKIEARLRLGGVAAADGGSCMLDYCVSWLDRQDNAVEAEFAHARLRAGIGAGAAVEIVRRDGGRTRVQLSPEERGARNSNQAFFLEWDHFLSGLDAGQPSLMSARSALLTAQVVDVLYQSAGTA